MISRERDFYLRRKANGTIAFRIKVPAHIQQAIGRNELQMNIPKADKRLALELARVCQDHFKNLDKVTPMVKGFNQAEVRRTVRQHMVDIIERWRAGRPLNTDDQWYCEQQGIEEHIDRLLEGVGRRQFLQHAGADTQRLFGCADASLARELMLAEIRAFKQILEEMELGPHDSVLDATEPIPRDKPQEPQPTPLASHLVTSNQPPEPETPAAGNSSAGPTMGEVVERFQEHKLSCGKWTANTVKDMSARLQGLLMFFGEDTPVIEVTMDRCREYISQLQQMRVGFVSRPGAILNGDATAPPDKPKLNSLTVREYCVMARAVLTFSEASGYLQGVIHPFPSMLVPVRKKGARFVKKAFTPEQVEAILSSQEFAEWSADSPARRWLFPILAYTGMRIEEACKLRAVDIREHEGIPVIDINESVGRNKNEHGTRLVPIHDRLLEMGLVQFAESLPPDSASDTGSMLFPELKPYNNRYSAMILKALNKFIHKIGYGKGYSNHSFRHFANNEAVKNGVRLSVADQLLGRTQQGIGGKVYFKGHYMESLREAINKIP